MLKLRPAMFTEARSTRVTSNLALQILIFVAVFAVIYIAEAISSVILGLPGMMYEFFEAGLLEHPEKFDFDTTYEISMEIARDWKVMVPTLVCTVFGIILSMVYCRAIEKRTSSSMGFRKRKWFPHYLTGLAAGIIMMSVITGITALLGLTEITVEKDFNIGIILLFFLGFLIQGASEEVIFRGYLMNTIGGSHSAYTALAVSSIAFALAHMANPGLTVLAFVNLVLFGLFAGLWMICFDDIWGACAIHSIWNFTQGNFFGISVSGTGNIESVLKTTAISDKTWLTGGQFGIEGSIFTTLVLAAASVLVILKIRKNSSAVSKEEPQET